MSRRAIFVAVVLTIVLAALVTPATTMAVGEGDAVWSPAAILSGTSSAPLAFMLPITPAGGGSCGGAGSCPS